MRDDLLLVPLSLVFGAVASVRNWLYDRRVLRSRNADIPVISVGNLAVGGTGKTPVSAEILRRLRSMGANPALVLRGYGEDEVEVHRSLNHGVAIFTGARRANAVAEAAAAGHDCVVLDDGFQHRRLNRDLDIVLIAAEHLDHPVALLPKGVWREPLRCVARADLVVVTRKTLSARAASRHARALKARRVVENPVLVHLRPTTIRPLGSGGAVGPTHFADQPALVVTTVAEPELFAGQMREMGVVTDLLAFPDHHTFTDQEVESIAAEARHRPVLLSRKEAVKLTGRIGDGAFVVDQEVVFDHGEDILDSHLKRTMGKTADA